MKQLYLLRWILIPWEVFVLFALRQGRLFSVMTVKTVFCVFLLIILTLLILLLVYPALHEAGHALSALILGADILDFELYPVSRVDVLISDASRMKAFIISACGGWFPLSALFVPDSGFYYLYYVKLSVGIVSLVNALTSLMTAAGAANGSSAFYDDAARLISVYPELYYPVVIHIALLIIISLSYLAFSGPIRKTADYFAFGSTSSKKLGKTLGIGNNMQLIDLQKVK